MTTPMNSGQATPVPPIGQPSVGIGDARAHFAAITARTPVDQAFRAAFLNSRIRLVHTHAAADLTSRDQAVQRLMGKLGPAARELDTQSVLGGTGYGMYYTDDFRAAWQNGTGIAFNAVCPQPPGGNVDTFLYITATNRSALGVEALVAYNGQNDGGFLVFDWSRSGTDPWQVSMSFSQLS
ncbi:MAG TPA: hypothetical protein VMA74_08005, partial [Dyella sp.]|uniref:hypothetical protein n=1 Tax=Dyella sp. TaxID=1869338 RepID=UPI002C65EBF5